MILHKIFSPPQILLLRLALFFFSLFFVFRVIFFLIFFSKSGEYIIPEIIKAFYIGARFDLRITILLILPFFIFSHIPFLDASRSKKALTGWRYLYLTITGIILFIFVADVLNYEYLKERISASLLQFAENLGISAGVVWQTYPVVWIFIGFLCSIVLANQGLKKWILKSYKETVPLKYKNKIVSVSLSCIRSFLLFLFMALGVHGKIKDNYSLRWSAGYFSTNSFVNAITLNPIHNFLDTISFQTKDFDEEKVRKSYSTISKFLKVNKPNRETLNFQRIQKPTFHPELNKKTNIVIVIMESVPAFLMSTFGNEFKLTPNLDRIAENGWLFENFYTSGMHTDEGIFSLVAGLPDASTFASLRDLIISDQNAAVNYFVDYDKYYFVGGSASWKNMKGFLKKNIIGLKLYEEGMYNSPIANYWGISDYHLFEEAHKVLAQRRAKKPFLAFIQMSTFHRPYMIPKDRGDFQLQYSKSSLSESKNYTSMDVVRFMDYSLGRFMGMMKESDFYDNTLFIFLSDHGIANAVEELRFPAGITKNLTPTMMSFLIGRFHAPLIFYASFLKPKKIKTVISQYDVLPTLAGLIGYEIVNKGIGRNIFDSYFKDKHYAFSYAGSSKISLFLFDEKYVAVGGVDNIQGLYNYRSSEKTKNIKDRYPEKFREMKKLLIGIYETSKFILYNNKNEPSKAK